MGLLQNARAIVYPDRCPACGGLVGSEGGLCGPCWQNTVFIAGAVCDGCGTSLPGTPDDADLCDDCIAIPRPWDHGRAAMSYEGTGRRLVLAFKHGDRLDIAPLAARWMARALAPIRPASPLLVPVPAHWSRRISRRFDPAAVLSHALSRQLVAENAPLALVRARRTATQEGRGRDARFANLEGAIRPDPRSAARVAGRDVVLVDDVMTSGATFTAAALAVLEAGAASVSVIALARTPRPS